MTLKKFRNECIQRRALLTREARFSFSLDIAKHLSHWIVQQDKYGFDGRILLFFPFRNELDIFRLHKDSALEDFSFFLPRLENSNSVKSMSFHVFDPHHIDQLPENKFGIKEAFEHAATWLPLDSKSASKSIVLVPALRIAKNGSRLGYGGGYYDRFLHKNDKNLISIGICYTEEYLEQADWVLQDHDQYVEYTATPNGIFKNTLAK